MAMVYQSPGISVLCRCQVMWLYPTMYLPDGYTTLGKIEMQTLRRQNDIQMQRR